MNRGVDKVAVGNKDLVIKYKKEAGNAVECSQRMHHCLLVFSSFPLCREREKNCSVDFSKEQKSVF